MVDKLYQITWLIKKKQSILKGKFSKNMKT